MRKECLDGDNIFVIHDFLTPAECASFIALSERGGYEDAPISTDAGSAFDKEVRDNARLIHDDAALAAVWWHRAQSFLPLRIKTWEAVGFNECFRFYRYDPGQQFGVHHDGYIERDNGEQSHYTFMVYLNDDFTGGSTNFYDFALTRRLCVQPDQGMALVFVHRQFHEGAVVTDGRKYVLRTDAFYAERAEPTYAPSALNKKQNERPPS